MIYRKSLALQKNEKFRLRLENDWGKARNPFQVIFQPFFDALPAWPRRRPKAMGAGRGEWVTVLWGMALRWGVQGPTFWLRAPLWYLIIRTPQDIPACYPNSHDSSMDDVTERRRKQRVMSSRQGEHSMNSDVVDSLVNQGAAKRMYRPCTTTAVCI